MTYLATATAGDAEMTRRIGVHRQRRPAEWRTVEETWDLAGVLARHAQGCLLVECLTLWLTNLLVGLPGRTPQDDDGVRQAVAELTTALGRATGQIVIVSNETGCGIMPVNELARRFGDLLGEANQRLASVAREVYWCVAGIPVRIKAG